MPTTNNLDSSHLERHLAEAQDRAEKGEFDAAVRAVREAKTLAPKNVYVLAFEKQAEQLHELDSAGTLTEEQRTDILESIPSIIERALESSRSPGTVTDISALKAAPGATQDKKEKAAALEWLKNQYFQHAHEYIRKGEYQNALAEIRRVYIIDPTNAIASDFEKQFEALAQMKRGETLRVYPTAAAPGKEPGAGEATEPPASGSDGASTEPTPVLTEEWSSPRDAKRDAAHHAQPQAKPRVSKKASTLLIALILLALCVLGVLLYVYYQRNVFKKAAVTSLAPPTSEQFIGAPVETAEQNFLVSNGDAGSGTPEVTALAANESPPAPAGATAKKSPGPAKPAPPRENKAPPSVPPGSGGQTPAASPPVMATQTQPDPKPSATPPATEDTVAPAPFVAIEKPARIIRLEKPKISSEGFLTGIEGQIVVQVRIDPTGKPVQTVTLKSTNDLLIQPVIDAVMASQYAPAEMTTGPVASWLTIPFRFASK